MSQIRSAIVVTQIGATTCGTETALNSGKRLIAAKRRRKQNDQKIGQ